MFVFNVTNHNAWLDGGGSVKLDVQEVGPLTYRLGEIMEHNITVPFSEKLGGKPMLLFILMVKLVMILSKDFSSLKTYPACLQMQW